MKQVYETAQLSDTSQRIKTVLSLPVNTVDVVKNRVDINDMNFPFFEPDQLSLFFPSDFHICPLMRFFLFANWYRLGLFAGGLYLRVQVSGRNICTVDSFRQLMAL